MADEDTALAMKGKVYGASLDILKEIIDEQTMDISGLDKALDRPTAVKRVDQWLDSQLKGTDGGKAALIALGMNFEPVTKAATTTPTVKPKSGDLPALWRKDFKVFGTITEQPGGLGYISLSRQIKAGLDKGHTEPEIIEGVIRAIQPGARLRSYLEGKQPLSLREMRGILQSHFREQTATELYKRLCNATQNTGESAIEFVMRTMDLKQRVLTASEEDKEVPYDDTMVERMFLHALATGLRDDNVRHRLEPMLEPGVEDVDLLKSVNQITLTEAEHSSKVKSKVNVNVCSQTMDQMQSEIKELKAQLNQLTSAKSVKKTNRRVRNQCKGCEGSDKRCEHCFKCGSSEHFAKGCRATKPLNMQGSLRQGNQRLTHVLPRNLLPKT